MVDVVDIKNVQEVMSSGNLEIITEAINYRITTIGQATYEIGQLLHYVKTNVLAHGEFLPWVKSIGINKCDAGRFIKVYLEFDEEEAKQLGRVVLFELAGMCETNRKRKFTLPNGKIKTPYEMSSREIKWVKKQIKAELEETKKALKAERMKNLVLESEAPDELKKVKGVHAKYFISNVIKHLEFVGLPLPCTEYKVGNYFVDMYFPELKLGLEYDEKHHKNQLEEDIKRQTEIENILGCEIIRIKEEIEDALNITKIVVEIMKRI